VNELEWESDPDLRDPIMIVALKGLFDAAFAATGAVEHLIELHDASELASVDPEEFFDFTQERPEVRLNELGLREILWPENRVYEAHIADGERDLVFLAGVEPHLKWRTFADHLVEVARRTGARMVVTLGAMVGMAPQTRPLGVVGSTTSSDLADRLGLGQPSYEGPTGLVGALHDALDRAGVPVISLRVSVPHYVPSPPNPEATRSLLARLELVTGFQTGHDSFVTDARTWRDQVDTAVADDPEMTSYVQELERQVDNSDDLLPTGDELAAQLEAFLRDQPPAE
jgi:proteasome assembly chaperone (PAC2) family protein